MVYQVPGHAFKQTICPYRNLERRSWLTNKKSFIRYKQEILKLPEAVHLYKQVSAIHCKGHQGDMSEVPLGNEKHDRRKEEEPNSSSRLRHYSQFPRKHPGPSSKDAVTRYENAAREMVTVIFTSLFAICPP